MAIINRDNFFSQLASGAKWNAGVSFLRTNPLPIDSNSVFSTLEAAQTYASTSAVAYPGQVIAVVDASGENSYFGIAQDGSLEAIGGEVSVDGKTIALSSGGELSLKNFGEKYYRYEQNAEAGTGTFIQTDWNDPTHPASNLSGMEVKIVKIAEGNFELAFYQSNPTTVEGIQSEISTIQSRLTDTYTKTEVNNLVNSSTSEWTTLD